MPLDRQLTFRSLADGESVEGCTAFVIPEHISSQTEPVLTFELLVLGRNYEVICTRTERTKAKKGKP